MNLSKKIILFITIACSSINYGFDFRRSPATPATLIGLSMAALGAAIYHWCSIQPNETYGVATAQGRRPLMQDAHFIKETADYSFFGVFDGHGSNLVSHYLTAHLYANIINQDTFFSDTPKAIIDAFGQTNSTLKESKGKIRGLGGSTAIVAIIKDSQLFIGNLGDSRAVLATQGIATALSADHKPISPTGYLINRAGHKLAVSSAFGDFDFLPQLNSNPDIKVHCLGPNDDFLILACDGIWDVLTNQQAVDVVKASLSKKPGNLNKAAQELIKQAYDMGSSDNLTAIIISTKNKGLKWA